MRTLYKFYVPLYSVYIRGVSSHFKSGGWGGTAVRSCDPQRKINYVHNVQSKYSHVHIINSKLNTNWRFRAP